MTIAKTSIRAWACALVLPLLLPLSASAQTGAYPNKPVRLIVPAAPGGGADFLARIVSTKLQEQTGQSFVVDNRAGASGTIAADLTAKAPADGYTLLLGQSTSMAIAPHLYAKLPYDTLRDLRAVTLVAEVPNILVVHPSVPAKTVKELIALAKAKPGTLNFGSSGVGNSIHLAVEQFNAAVGIKAVHVPFKTGNETDTAMIAGEVQYTIASLATSLPLIQAGRIKALAVTGEGRDPALPNVPNLSESGLPVRIPDQLFGMVGPANMPAPVTSKLLKAVADMQADPAFQESVRRTGGVPSLVHGEAFRNLALSDSQTWGDLIKRLGITLSS